MRRVRGRNAPVICFAHIERAGGSSLHEWLRSVLADYHVLTPRSFWSNDFMSVIGGRELNMILNLAPRASGLGGHSLQPWVDFAHHCRRDLRWFTFVRDPVSRLLSHLNHQRLHMGLPWSFDEFIGDPRFHNVQTVRIAGGPWVDRAISILREKFFYVGIAEEYRQSVGELAGLMGAVGTSAIPFRNATRMNVEATRLADLTDRERRRIEGAVELDMRLYSWVRDQHARGELWKQPVSGVQLVPGKIGSRRRREGLVWVAVEAIAHRRWAYTREEARDKFVARSRWSTHGSI